MAKYLVTKWFGVFLCDGRKVSRFLLFPREREAIAERIRAIQSGELLDEERQLSSRGVLFTDSRLSGMGKVVPFNSDFIRPEDYNFSEEMLRDAMLRVAEMGMSYAVPEDRHIVQAVEALDDLTEKANLMAERTRAWYSLYFPELPSLLKSEEELIGFIAEHGRREEIMEALEEKGMEIDSTPLFIREISDDDMEVMRSLANLTKSTFEEMNTISRYIEKKMQQIAPNLSSLIGPILGARLISLAGGLKRLAILPSGTVQLLGAEAAMFRHIKEGSAGPKHGIIFQHPMLHSAPPWQRGSIARAIAGKISIAARADAFGGADISDRLKADLEARLEEIKNTRKEAPLRRKRGPKREVSKKQSDRRKKQRGGGKNTNKGQGSRHSRRNR